MAEYIDRGKLLQHICNGTCGIGYEGACPNCDTVGMIEEFPAADVAPVVHGYWDDSGRYTFPGGSTAVRCSKCGCALTVSEYHLQNWYYCPVCGAKMDGGDGNAPD